MEYVDNNIEQIITKCLKDFDNVEGFNNNYLIKKKFIDEIITKHDNIFNIKQRVKNILVKMFQSLDEIHCERATVKYYRVQGGRDNSKSREIILPNLDGSIEILEYKYIYITGSFNHALYFWDKKRFRSGNVIEFEISKSLDLLIEKFAIDAESPLSRYRVFPEIVDKTAPGDKKYGIPPIWIDVLKNMAKNCRVIDRCELAYEYKMNIMNNINAEPNLRCF